MHIFYSNDIHWVYNIPLDTRLITSKYCVIQTVCVFYLRLYEAGVSGVFISLAWQWWSRRTAINTHYTRPPTITCPNLHSPRKKHHNLWQYVTIQDNPLSLGGWFVKMQGHIFVKGWSVINVHVCISTNSKWLWHTYIGACIWLFP